MLRYLLITILLSLSLLSNSQISTRTIKKEIGYTLKAPPKYNYKVGFTPQQDPIDFLQYIGLEIFLPKLKNMSEEDDDRYHHWQDKHQNIQLWKYNNSKLTRKELIDRDNNDENQIHQNTQEDTSYFNNIYKPLNIRFTTASNWKNISFSNNDSISDRYYTIIDITYTCVRNNEGEAVEVDNLALTIVDKISKDTVIFFPTGYPLLNNDMKNIEPNGRSLISPFILVPYFVELQKKYDNIKILFTGNYGGKLKDIDTDRDFYLNNKSTVSGKIELAVLKDIYENDYAEQGSNYENNFYYGIFLFLKTQEGNTFPVRILEDGVFRYSSTITTRTSDIEDEEDFFIYKDYIETQKLNQQQRKQAEAQKKQEEQKKLSTRFNILKEKYGARFATLIINQKVEIGMTKEICLAAWGEPVDKHKTIRQDFEIETWTYSFKSSLIFKNGVLFEITQ